MSLKLNHFILSFLAIILIAAFLFQFLFFRKILIEGSESRLINSVDHIVVSIAKNPTLFYKSPEKFLFSTSVNEFVASSYMVQFVDSKGNILAKSPNLLSNNLPFASGETDLLEDIEFIDGIRIKTYQSKIIVNRKTVGYVIVGISTTQMFANLSHLRNLIFAIGLVTLIVLGLGVQVLIFNNVIKNQKRFLSFASHELRTPLAIITGHSEIALKQENSLEWKKALQIIKRESEWMNKVVENLLFVFRTKSGTEKLNYESFNLSELISECLMNFKQSFPNQKICLNLPEKIAMIEADPYRIKQVVNNLLENAAKHNTQEGMITLTLKYESYSYHLSITDEGDGMSDETKKKIFNLFYKADKNRRDGTGLGLSIASWIMAAHKGKIKVDSTLGKGSIFTITLPEKRKG